MVGLSLGNLDAIAASCAVPTFLVSYALLKHAFRPYPEGVVPCPRPGGIVGFLLQHGAVFRNEHAGEPALRWARAAGGVQPIGYNFALPVMRVCVPHPNDVHHILMANSANYMKPAEYKALALLLGNGLITMMDEAAHTEHRRTVGPAFSSPNVRRMANNIMRVHAGRAVTAITDAATKSPTLDLAAFFNEAALGIIAETAFKSDILTDSAVANSFTDLNDAFRMSPVHMLLASYGLPNKTAYYAKRLRVAASACVARILQEKAAPESPRGRVLMDYLVQAPGLSQTAITDHSVTFMFAGYDTSSTVLLWVAFHLARYPRVQERLFEELFSAMGTESCPRIEELAKLPYLRAVINEVMRVCPVVTNVGRHTIQDDFLPHSKVWIPAGTPVHISIYVTHHLKEIWGEDADEFRPERWEVPGFEENLPPCSFIPFVAGKRGCIGKEFALAEITVVLAMLVRRVRIGWPQGQPVPQRMAGVVIKVDRPMMFTITPRE